MADEQASKNAVFNNPNPTGDVGGIQELSREQYAKSQFGFEIPVDAVPLPSRGLLYEDGHPLCGVDRVEFRAMTAREEDILMSQALIKKGTVITELIRSCLIDKRINPDHLLSGDRNALMIAIRATGYSAEYNPSLICPACEHKNELQVNLNELPLKTLSIEPIEPRKNIFSFVLPRTGKTVHFKFLTVEDEQALLNQLNTMKKKGFASSNVVSARLRTSIVAVDGNSNKSFVAQFAQNMLAADSSALRKYIDDHEPGVDMSIDFQCVNCEHFEEVAVPMDSTFFWPNSRRS